MDEAKKVNDPVIQHHVMMEVAGEWVLLRSLDVDCLEQAQAFASEYAAINHCEAIVATTAVSFTGRLTISDVEKGFSRGEKFVHRDGRHVIAVHKPGYFQGEDGDTLLVQFEGVDYGGDFWDEVQVSNLVSQP